MPIHIASQNGHAHVVKLLLAVGIHLDVATTKHGSTSLHLATGKGHANVVQLLLTVGANQNLENLHGSLPIHVAACNGNADILRILLYAGINDPAQPSGREVLSRHVPAGPAKEFLKRWPKSKILTMQLIHEIASNRCTFQRLQELVGKGADVHAYFINHVMATPLHIAVRHANVPVIIGLLRYGADPTITDVNNETPVHVALQKPVLLGLFGMIASCPKLESGLFGTIKSLLQSKASNEQQRQPVKEFSAHWGSNFHM